MNGDFSGNPPENQEEIETPGFLIYREAAYILESIRDPADAGRVIQAITAYFLFGETPPKPFEDKRMRDAFNKLRGDIDRDAASYRKRVQRSRENGKKGGRPKKPKTHK